MARTLSPCTVAAALALVAAAPAQAAIASFRFDSTPDTAVSVPLAGSGTFSFDGTPMGNSTVALSTLSNVAFSFSVGRINFSLADLVTPLANIQVRFTVTGRDLLVSFGGSGGGPQNGSADFRNASGFLSFQPDFGSLYAASTPAGFLSGNFDGLIRGSMAVAMPEPVSLALVLLGLAAASASRRPVRPGRALSLPSLRA